MSRPTPEQAALALDYFRNWYVRHVALDSGRSSTWTSGFALARMLEGTGLELLRSAGSYFQIADFGGVDARGDVELAAALIDEAGVATIPLSVFYR